MVISSENLGLTTNTKPLGQLTLHSPKMLAFVIPKLNAEFYNRIFDLSSQPRSEISQVTPIRS